jgi:hypothetical protein
MPFGGKAVEGAAGATSLDRPLVIAVHIDPALYNSPF